METEERGGRRSEPASFRGTRLLQNRTPVVLLVAFSAATILFNSGVSSPTQTSPPTAQHTIAPPASGEQLDRPHDAEGLIDSFLGFNSGQESEWRTLAHDHPTDPRLRYHVEILIVTLPDPSAPLLQNKFDRHLDAIQRAAETAGYVLDRYYLPVPQKLKGWLADASSPSEGGNGDATTPSSATASSVSDRIEHEPGVILFRQRERLLVVFLVGEHPTDGVYKLAMMHAFNQASAISGWPRSTVLSSHMPREPHEGASGFSLLGPYFSGSARSLEFTIQKWRGSFEIAHEEVPQVTLISGTATSVEGDVAASLDFHSMLIPDSVSSQLILNYLTSKLGVPKSEIAVVTEGDTSYGRAYASGQDVLRLEFPLHISELRAAEARAKASAGDPAALNPLKKTVIPLYLGEVSEAPYIIPHFSPRTPASAEIELSKLFSTISGNGIRYIVLASSDVEDRIFLAQELRYHCPDAKLVTSSSDLLYLHSDAVSDLQGMLVFSTYPLLTIDQLWTYPFSGARLQFPTDSSEGVFNATLALLHEEDEMLEYGHPFENDSRLPGLWVTVVGRNDLWPAAFIYPDRLDYLFERHSSERQAPLPVASVLALYSPAVLAKWVILSLFCVIGGSLFVAQFPVALGPRGRRLLWSIRQALPASSALLFGDTRCEPVRLERRSYQLALSLSFLTLSIIVSVLFVLPLAKASRFHFYSLSAIHLWPVLAFILSLLSIVVTLISTIGLLTPTLESYAKHSGTDSSLRWQSTCLISAVSLILLLALAFVVSAWWVSPLTALFTFIRSVNLSSGVSPLLPMLLVTGAFMLLISCSLRRTRLLETSLGIPFLDFGEDSFAGVSGLASAVLELAHCAFFKLPGAFLVVLILVVCAGPALLHPDRSMDGLAFDLLFRVASVVVYLTLALEFLRFVSVWRALKRLLIHLYWHPTRTSYERLHATAPGGQRINLGEPGPSFTALESSLERAREILLLSKHGKPESPVTQLAELTNRLRTVEEIRPKALGAVARGRWADAARSFHAIESEMSKLTSTTVSTLEPLWRSPGSEEVVSAAEDQLRDRGGLFIAARVVDFLRQIFPLLENLAWFSMLGMLLMLLAVSTYPFPQREELLWYSWFVVLSAVAGTLYVFFSMNRDRIVSLLSGTTPGKLDWNASLVSQLAVYGVLPVLGLVGTQFPAPLRQALTWLTTILGRGHP
jgi:hypothetical protein